MLNLILFSGGLVVSLIASGGLLFTIREFRRFDHDTDAALAYLEDAERAATHQRSIVDKRPAKSKDKYVGAGI